MIAQVLQSGVVQLFVDNRRVLECRQTTALSGSRYPGVWTWGAGEFDDVKIYAAE